MAETFYWHDYETWGKEPWRSRPCQFAGVRTDAELNPCGAPLVLLCRPTDDLLPEPEACLTNGLTPLRLWNAARGELEWVVDTHYTGDGQSVPLCHEVEFAARIHHELAHPGTCGVGFNTRRFDDKVTRALFYRNFYDPYAHTHQNGNTRWDLIDVLRLAHALRPEGVTWPQRPDGTTSFKLPDLCPANAIVATGRAHDALVDVYLTIALAKQLKTAQPKLFAYSLTLRDKDVVNRLADQSAPFLHVSAHYPAERGCIAPVLALGRLSDNPNAVLVFDLRHDPAELADLSVTDIRQRLFTANADLPPDKPRIAIKQLRTNTTPMVAPMSTLTPAAAERWAIDLDMIAAHARQLQQLLPTLQGKLHDVYRHPKPATAVDPELALYQGGFLSTADKLLLAQVRAMTPAQLATSSLPFKDARLPPLLFRYRARNWPESLNETEREDWDAWRFEKLTAPMANGDAAIDHYLSEIMQRRDEYAHDAAKLAILDALELWAEQVMDVGE